MNDYFQKEKYQMKKALSVFTVLIIMLLLTVGSALAADGLIFLVETRNDSGGGVIFVLEFSGEFPRNYFQGFVTEGDNRYPIDCNVVSENVVQCTVSRATAGKNVVLYVGEFIFWTFVPEASGELGGVPGGPTEYCYNIYNAQTDQNEQDFFWVPVGVNCQDVPASDGDTIEYDTWFYEFWTIISDGYCGVNGNSEQGYFEICLG
jgi:hypothetical protein